MHRVQNRRKPHTGWFQALMRKGVRGGHWVQTSTPPQSSAMLPKTQTRQVNNKFSPMNQELWISLAEKPTTREGCPA